MSNLIHATDENFTAEVLQSEMPVLVDFSATWCGPCKHLEPIVAELAEEYAGRLKVVHVDVDHARSAAMQFGVMSVPTVLFMKDGKVLESQIGVAPKAKMVDKIEQKLL